MKEIAWGLAGLWNQALESKKDKILTPREKIWASEMGGAYIDRYLKMKAVPPTNPPNARSRRKFEAGNIWEAIIGYVLSRAGILIDSQEWVQYQYGGLLPVSGRLDFMAGGNPDYDKASYLIQGEFKWLPEFITKATLSIVEGLKSRYPGGLKKIVLEIKSCSAFMFEVYEKKNTADNNHALQCFHYLKSKGMDEGHVVYVCRDDARVCEVGVFNPGMLESIYKNDIEKMTNYLKQDREPEREKPIVFESKKGRFNTNWKMAYSQYLTKIYGLKNQMAFEDIYKPMVERWNRVLSRIKDGKDMTDKNKAAIEEMGRMEFNMEKIKEQTIIQREVA